MNRRDLLIGAGAVALASVAKAAPKDKPDPAHQHGGPTPLVDAALDCEKKAEACLQHCLVLLGSGDASMVGCAMAVRDTLASSRAVATLAAAGSKFAAPLAKVCADICRACSAECKKHADKHAPCKDCMDACDKMSAEIAKLPA